jgi:hypothetical protein
VRLRARVCESEETRVFTAWVRRKPVVVTARAGGQSPVVVLPATTCGRAGLACCSAPRRGWVDGGAGMQCSGRLARVRTRPGMVEHGGTGSRAGLVPGASSMLRGHRGTARLPRVNAAVGSGTRDSGACRARGRAREYGVSIGIGPGPAGRRLFIWLVSSRPIGETTEGITCFSPRGRGKWPFSRAAGDTGRPGASVEPKIRSASAAAADRRDACRAPPSTASTRTYARVVTPIQ